MALETGPRPLVYVVLEDKGNGRGGGVLHVRACVCVYAYVCQFVSICVVYTLFLYPRVSMFLHI